MDDVLAVLDAAGCERPTVLAETEGTALACLFAATHPERVELARAVRADPAHPRRARLPVGARPGAARDVHRRAPSSGWGEGVTSTPPRPPSSGDAAAARLVRAHGAARGRPRRGRADDARDRRDRRARHPAADPRPDARHAPRRDDTRVDRRHAEYRPRPRARRALRRAAGDREHPVPRRHRAARRRARGARDRRRARRAPPERVLATVLFTDIVGSTERAVGGRRPRAGASCSTPTTRSSAPRSPPTAASEVKTLGDGFLATFDGPARAVRCALRGRRALGDAGVRSAPGIHTGECERVGGDVAGIAVHIAARVLGEAGAGRGARVAHRHRPRGGLGACASTSRGAAGAARRARRVGAVRGGRSAAERPPRARPRRASAGRAGPPRRPSSPPAGPPRSRRCARGRRPPSRPRRAGTCACARRRAATRRGRRARSPPTLNARIACANTSGSQEPSGHTGPVPETSTRSPTRIAREKPIGPSNGEPDVARDRSAIGVPPVLRRQLGLDVDVLGLLERLEPFLPELAPEARTA